jgi:NADH:ubiquinone oxidoreductase subunit E
MLRITICIGSACHLKGSRQVIEKLQQLVQQNGLSDQVDLTGSFCTGNCVNAVCVTLDGKLYSLKPETTEDFFNNEVLGRLKK